MPATILPPHCAAGCLALLSVFALATANADPDVYAAAVGHPGRSADDLKRDPIDHPAEVLRLSGIRPNMRVGDIGAADGYYSELVSYIVGPKGHVFLLNNAAWDHWSGNGWTKRLENDRLPNVEHRTVDFEHLNVPDHSLDAVLLVKVYHDFYWVDTQANTLWPKMDPQRVLSEIARVTKPGGILLLVDHSAKIDTGSADAGRLHRIDERFARAEFEKHGFEYVSSSDVLRQPDDPRTLISYEGPMLGKTDRFVMVLRKRGT